MRRLWVLVGVLGLFLFPGCDSGGTPSRCSSSRDCAAGRVCVDNRCVIGADTGNFDAGERDAGEPTDTPGGADVPVTPGEDGGPGGLDAPVVMAADEDGDSLTDEQEGRSAALDTDRDGVPDFRDVDSDGDGLFDAAEAGDANPATPPADSDGDGLPNFRDLDSDGNGVLDAVEGGEDIDGDGRIDAADLDNDGDGLLDRDEVGSSTASPRDSDGDGAPDYDEIDSDADTISDTEEDLFDTDADGLRDGTDTDSDDDGWLDAVEAGDASLLTQAIDTDADGVPDYRDPDSDGDGLSDAAERGYGTSRTGADTDGDGVSDLIEIGAGSSATNPADSPRTRGDFVFLVPFMEPPDPTRDTLQFSTSLQRADVYFLMDNTGSMGGTIAALQSGLTSTVIPSITSSIPEAWFGVGGFDDYPLGGYGLNPCGSTGYGTNAPDSAGIRHDVPFFQYTTMTSSTTAAQAAVNRYQVNCGEDGPEGGVAALHALASRDTLGGYARFPGTSPPACAAGGRGAACFRADAVPIVIVMTDVNQHNDPTCACPYSGIPSAPSWAGMLGSLAAINARVVGIATSTGANAFLTRLVEDTTIARGAPGPAAGYVLSAPGGSGLSSAIVDVVRRAAQVPLDVSAQAVDLADPGETVNAVTAFIDHLETRTTPAPGLSCTTGFVTVDRAGIDGDSFPDTHNDVTPGAPVCFDILPRMNTTVAPTLVPQVFRAQINVIGDGFTPLDDRVVYFLVPPRIPDPGS
jgi:hypothetical protein